MNNKVSLPNLSVLRDEVVGNFLNYFVVFR